MAYEIMQWIRRIGFGGGLALAMFGYITGSGGYMIAGAALFGFSIPAPQPPRHS